MTASVKQDRFSNVNLLYSIQDKYQTNQDQSFHSNQSNLSNTGNYNALKSLSMLPPPSMGMATNSDVGTKNDMGSVSWYNNPKRSLIYIITCLRDPYCLDLLEMRIYLKLLPVYT